MEKINLYGCTTAEKLVALTKGINDVYNQLVTLGFLLYKDNYIEGTNIYDVGQLVLPSTDSSIVNRPIYFQNGWIGIIEQEGNSKITIGSPFYLKGEQGIQGKQGEQGEQGVGIRKIENFGSPSVGVNYTTNHIEVELSNGQKEYFDIQAENGNSPTVQQIPYIELTLPTETTSGTLSIEQLNTLKSNNLAYIILNNEIYYPMEKNTTSNLLYVHSGYTSSNSVFAEKAITITETTQSFVINTESSKIWKITCGIYISAENRQYSAVIYYKGNEVTTIQSLMGNLWHSNYIYLFGFLKDYRSGSPFYLIPNSSPSIGSNTCIRIIDNTEVLTLTISGIDSFTITEVL